MVRATIWRTISPLITVVTMWGAALPLPLFAQASVGSQGEVQASQAGAEVSSAVQPYLDTLFEVQQTALHSFYAAQRKGDTRAMSAALSPLRAFARRAVAKFDGTKATPNDIGGLGVLHMAAEQHDAGLAIFRRYVKDEEVSVAERADMLEAAQELVLFGASSTAEFDVAEQLVVLADTLGVAATRIQMRAALERAHRGTPKFKTALDAPNPSALMGTKAEPIVAQRWINAPHASRRLTFGDGNIYVLEFTAHWCAPCHASYPALQSLYDKYKTKGVHVILATQLYGYFGSAHEVGPRAEFDSLTRYFAEHKVSVPVAVAGQFEPGTIVDVGGNCAKYNATGLPTIVIVDGSGVVRYWSQGWDAGAEKHAQDVRAALERLLNSVP